MLRSLSLLLIVVSALASGPALASERLLGRVRLSYSERDLDIIRVQNTCRNPNRDGFRAIRLVVDRGDADIQGLFVQYGNGRREQLPVRQRFRSGSSSRYIDLKGNQRCLVAIAILGDTNNLRSRQQARVRVFGIR
ncbi:MAG: DUF2541 family protein [Oscillatoriales cyanobacterium SM2_2_1]|nr:DUF2541 family protein [Oscillatoriales cyanobacterium SM2_2_1]